MTSHLQSQFNASRIVRTVSCVVIAGLVAVAGTQLEARDAASQSYTWSAELVGFDEASNTATVQARIVSHSEIDDFSEFSKGDQIMLTWSGAYGSATGVRNMTHDTSVDEGQLFTMPVEFVSMVLDNRYVQFTVSVPSADAAKIRGLEPGKWVTATSPQEPANQAEAVSTIRPYNS